MNKFQPYTKNFAAEKIVISFRLDETRLKKIDKLACGYNISRNEFIKQCIDLALNNLEDQENKQPEENEKTTK